VVLVGGATVLLIIYIPYFIVTMNQPHPLRIVSNRVWLLSLTAIVVALASFTTLGRLRRSAASTAANATPAVGARLGAPAAYTAPTSPTSALPASDQRLPNAPEA
jgi:hypothetical protein